MASTDCTSYPLGFPTEYFSIKSVATGRLLEIYNNETKDDSPVALWPAKEQSLVESMRRSPPINLEVVRLLTTIFSVSLLALRSPDIDNQVSVFTHLTDISLRRRFIPCYVISHQVFFVGSTGALCSRASGHSVDLDSEPSPHALYSRAVLLNHIPGEVSTRPPP